MQKQIQTPAPFDLAGLHRPVSLIENMEYLPDPERKLDLQAAMKSRKWQPMVRPRLGYLDYPVWTRLKLINTDSSDRSAVLFNQRPMLHYLDITILENGIAEDRISLGFMPTPSEESNYIPGYLSSFFINLKPGGEKTVISRLKSPGIMETGWDAATLQQFSKKSRRNILALGLNWGIMLAIIIVAVISWAVHRQRKFGLLLGYSVFFTLMVVSLNGLPRILSLGLPPWFWFIGSFVFPIASVVCWIYFTQFLLNTGKTMPLTHIWLKILTVILTVCIITYIAGPWFPSVFRYSPLWILFVLLTCITVIIAGILGVIRKLPHSRLYLFGHALMFNAAVLMIILGQSSILKELATGLLIYPWIVAAHVTVLGISLNIISSGTRRELEAQRQSELENSRFTAVGRIIAMVVHQWRTPLARLGTELTELNLYFRQDSMPESRLDFIKKTLLPSMNRNMENLNSTVNDFSNFFSCSQHKEKFKPMDLLNQALEMAGGRIHGLNVRAVMPEEDEELFLYARPSVLTHVLLVIIANALDTFEDRKTPEPVLEFHIRKDENSLIITIGDNGGGIDIKPVEMVFETFVSEKGRDHMGMGLNIVRRLVKEVMGGSVRVENSDSGALFTIIIPSPPPQ